MKAKVILFSLAALLATVLFAAVDISGKWQAEFDTQIGKMTYAYTFRVSGEKITGTAESDMMGGKQQTELKDIKLAGDELTFTEPLTIKGNTITITYKGKVSGNEIKFTRQVGEFATEELIAKRMAAGSQGQVANQAQEDTPAAGGRRGGVPAPNADWAVLKRYQAENAALAPPTPGKPRVVFMGDSITQGWAAQRASFFADNGYVGRGISAQTSSQMLLRFHQDVVALKPAAVVILAGTNDVAGNTGPMADEQIIDNLTAMTEIARANGIKVVIGSVPPATTFFWRSEVLPAPRIKALNGKIKAWARSQKIIYADFWTAMALPDGTMNTAYSSDTVHPNGAGYAIMDAIVQAAISEALKP